VRAAWGALLLVAPLSSGALESTNALEDVIPPDDASRPLSAAARELSPAHSESVRLPRLAVTLGSTPAEVVAAAEQCNRDARAEACTPDTFASELGGTRVVVEAFWLDRREVSYGQYRRCVEVGRCGAAPYDGAERLERDDLPVVFVTHDDARDYCAFRGARLPTEGELERAARGAERRVFPWGSHFNARAVNGGRWGAIKSDDRDGFDELSPVDAFPSGRTPEGISNLAGNVAEWTSTPYAPYTEPSPAGPDRVIRGGHYLAAPVWLRSAARLHEPPGTRAAYIGFRCARSEPHGREDVPARPR
jgi:formylglycine-generating enzyme required for sulfatase activity